jgi:hypothetical protein
LCGLFSWGRLSFWLLSLLTLLLFFGAFFLAGFLLGVLSSLLGGLLLLDIGIVITHDHFLVAHRLLNLQETFILFNNGIELIHALIRSAQFEQLLWLLHDFVHVSIKVLDGLLLCEVRITLHIVIEVDQAPVSKVDPVSHHVLIQRMVNHSQLWWCFKFTFKYCNVVV